MQCHAPAVQFNASPILLSEFKWMDMFSLARDPIVTVHMVQGGVGVPAGGAARVGESSRRHPPQYISASE
jgi:hypothetical protein